MKKLRAAWVRLGGWWGREGRERELCAELERRDVRDGAAGAGVGGAADGLPAGTPRGADAAGGCVARGLRAQNVRPRKSLPKNVREKHMAADERR